MRLLRRSAGLPEDGYRTDERWMELGFGSWEGHGWKDLRRLHPKLHAERERDRWVFTPPGGGESYATLAVRVGDALAALARDTVVVSHGGVARVVMTILAGAATTEALAASIWQGRILLFQDGRHRWV